MIAPRRPADVRHTARHGVIAAAAAILAACASGPPLAVDRPKVVHGQDIAPYAIQEQCVHLAIGDRLDYDFTANEPVDFNIHYHEGRAVVSPIVRDKVRQDSGLFVPLFAQDYCLMWEAGAAGALLDYRISLRPAAR
jgi:hypothetical protein